jgi:homoserine O-acetyltransferase
MEAAFADIRLESARVIGVDTDFLWPPHQQREICRMFSAHGINCHLEMLPSIQGHDSFLVDYKRFCPAVAGYLQNLE